MSDLSANKRDWQRFGLAILSGLMLAAAFPKISFAGLAWLAPGLMLLAARGTGRPFRLGYLAGLAHYLASLYWLLNIPVMFMPIVGWLALSLFLALYPATWVWLCQRAHARLPAESTIGQRLRWALFCAAAWVALEMIAARFLSGFPWNLLGASQYQMLPLIQIASLAGIYGVSFLVVWFSVSLLLVLQRLLARPGRRLAWLGEIALPLATVLLIGLWGMARLTSPPPASPRKLSVALVQPSIPQTVIWDGRESENRFQQLLKLSEVALATKPDLLIWPEAAVPKLIRDDRDIYEAVTNLARTHQVWMIIGADDFERRPQPGDPDAALYFNSSFLVSPRGELAATYRKRRLVIFGEYVPLADWLPFLKKLTPITGGFTPGERIVPFEIPALKVKTAVLICFEDVFPHLTREYADEDTDFLVNLTNDGWFGESAAQWQHAANAVFRAVENGLPLVRCANNGLTCWVDARGGLHEIYFGDSRDIYGVGFKTAQIPLLPPGERRAPTFYNRHGDWFGWTCVALTAGVALGQGRKRGGKAA